MLIPRRLFLVSARGFSSAGVADERVAAIVVEGLGHAVDGRVLGRFVEWTQ